MIRAFRTAIGGWLYYSRTETGKQYPIHCRKRAAEAAEEVTLDLNALAEGHAFLALGAYAVSDDGRWLAYSVDYTGFREYTLCVKDLVAGELQAERIDKVSSVAWAADSATIFYVLEDAAKRPYRLLRHRLGAPVAEDPLLYEEADELFRLGVWRSRSRSSAVRRQRQLHRDGIPLPVGRRARPAPGVCCWRGEKDHEYSVDHGVGPARRRLLHPHQRRWPAQLPPGGGAGGRSAAPSAGRS